MESSFDKLVGCMEFRKPTLKDCEARTGGNQLRVTSRGDRAASQELQATWATKQQRPKATEKVHKVSVHPGEVRNYFQMRKNYDRQHCPDQNFVRAKKIQNEKISHDFPRENFAKLVGSSSLRFFLPN